jgi:hypothetical protein
VFLGQCWQVFRTCFLPHTLSVAWNVVTCWCVVLFDTSLPGYAMQSNVQERARVLLVNIPCSHTHRFCATSMISSLATRLILIWCHGGGGRVYYMEMGPFLISFLYCSTWLLMGYILNGTPWTKALHWTWSWSSFSHLRSSQLSLYVPS